MEGVSDPSHDFSHDEIPPSYQAADQAPPPAVVMGDDFDSSSTYTCGHRCGVCCRVCFCSHTEDNVSFKKGNEKYKCHCSVCCTLELSGYAAAFAGAGTGVIGSVLLCCGCLDPRSCGIYSTICCGNFAPWMAAFMGSGGLFGLSLCFCAGAGSIYLCRKHGVKCTERQCPNFSRGFAEQLPIHM